MIVYKILETAWFYDFNGFVGADLFTTLNLKSPNAYIHSELSANKTKLLNHYKQGCVIFTFRKKS